MTTYTSQPDETDGIDTYIGQFVPTSNYGTEVIIEVGVDNRGAGADCTILIKFDLSSIPAGSAITSATLSLWTEADYATNGNTYSLYRSLRAWSESQATWNVYTTGNNWGLAGAYGTATDFDNATGTWSDCVVTNSETVPTEKQWVFSATGVAELQKMINGTYTNNGFVIHGAGLTNNAYSFHSSSSATAGYRPKLVIEYSGGGWVTIWS